MAVDVSQMKAEIEGIVHAAMLNEFSDEGAMIESRLQAQIQTFVDGIEKKVIEQIGKSGKIPVIHRIEFNDEALLRMKVRGHAMLKKAVQAASAGCNVLLVGPDGCGKSTMAKHMAKLLKCENFLITSFPDIVTAHLADNSLTCFQNIHRYDQRTLMKCRQLIDTNPKAKFAATMLRGLEIPRELAPAFPLAKITMEFDKDIESQICPDSEILLKMWRWRELATTKRCLQPIFCTRTIQEAYKLITGAGWTLEEVRDLATSDWTLQERSMLTLE